MEQSINVSPKKTARMAGVWYLVVVILAPIGHMYIPSLLLDRTSASVTATQLLENENLFRLQIFLEVAVQLAFVMSVMFLYNLLKGLNELWALTMKTLVVIGSPVTIVSSVLKISALLFLKSNVYDDLEPAQIQNIALMLFRVADYGAQLNNVFWGLWLVPLGMLVWISKFVPKVFGALLIANGTGYVMLALVFLFLPTYLSLAFKYSIPLLLGEIWFVGWLLVKGVREE